MLETPDVLSISGLLGGVSYRVTPALATQVLVGRIGVTDLIRTTTSPASEPGSLPVYEEMLAVGAALHRGPLALGALLSGPAARFAVDRRPGKGQTYFALPGAGILERVAVLVNPAHPGGFVRDDLLASDDQDDVGRARHERAELAAGRQRHVRGGDRCLRERARTSRSRPRCLLASGGVRIAGGREAVAAVLALGQGDAERAAALVRSADDARHQGLFLSVARAALADHGQGADIDSPAVADVLEYASREDLASEPMLVVLLGDFAAKRGDLAEAIRLFEAAAAADPPPALARLELAHALIARAGSGGSVVAADDRLHAQALAREVLEEVRGWSGPSEKALSVLLKTQMVVGAFQEMIRLATPESLGGAALDREAASGEVAVYGAEAARAMGDRAQAASFADLVAGRGAEGSILAGPHRPLRAESDQGAAAGEAGQREQHGAVPVPGGPGVRPLPAGSRLARSVGAGA